MQLDTGTWYAKTLLYMVLCVCRRIKLTSIQPCEKSIELRF